jgi:hypothetical protein
MTPDDTRARAVERIKQKRGFQQTAATFAVVWIVLIVIWAVAGGGFFWPIFPILAMAIALAFQGYGTYGKRREISEADRPRGPAGGRNAVGRRAHRLLG